MTKTLLYNKYAEIFFPVIYSSVHKKNLNNLLRQWISKRIGEAAWGGKSRFLYLCLSFSWMRAFTYTHTYCIYSSYCLLSFSHYPTRHEPEHEHFLNLNLTFFSSSSGWMDGCINNCLNFLFLTFEWKSSVL